MPRTADVVAHCNGKMCLSYREAREMINAAHRCRWGHRKGKIPVREYYCPDCGTYHLTSMPYYPGKRKNKRKQED